MMPFLFTLASVDDSKAVLLVWDYSLCFQDLSVSYSLYLFNNSAVLSMLLN